MNIKWNSVSQSTLTMWAKCQGKLIMKTGKPHHLLLCITEKPTFLSCYEPSTDTNRKTRKYGVHAKFLVPQMSTYRNLIMNRYS